jgi:hypothetical protein
VLLRGDVFLSSRQIPRLRLAAPLGMTAEDSHFIIFSAVLACSAVKFQKNEKNFNFFYKKY